MRFSFRPITVTAINLARWISLRLGYLVFSRVTIIVRDYRNFDGLDIDWEFPRGKEDKDNFVKLLKDLREAFEVAFSQFAYLVTHVLKIWKLYMLTLC